MLKKTGILDAENSAVLIREIITIGAEDQSSI
jgi:hypothetical protein